ncbi:hypothetical protein SCUCBS95973_009912 [Sporothrix curviconia]|uniref:Short chain oxidoreductase/dehydrogenase n=1 Tax=Sporothrix curviconia TaxID=1260050 RepID=A0ABP0CYS2_9PEZI
MSAALKPAFTTPDRPLTWLITGCSSGIGLALVRHAIASGHRVIATSRNPARTPELVKEVEAAAGNGSTGPNRWLTLDVDEPSAAASLVRQLEVDEGIAIDVLVNNAGFAVLQTVERASEADVRAEMETQFFGPLRLMQAVLPHMRRRRFGVIVYVSSGSGLEARPSLALYGSAKAAGDALIKTLAKEVAPFNIRAFYASLGSFRTSMPDAVRVGKPAAIHSTADPVAAATAADEDYKGDAAGQVMSFMQSGGQTTSAEGDPLKVARAIFELASATGIGRGREAEVLLPLGRDSGVRVREVRATLDHAMEVFGELCDHVRIDDEWIGGQ